ncbi:hypothetical protein [Paenibacillus tengchongensis]|uniref:hypothetical protein n=1 Tax=Paenibacillus tengchongensis TaxID=2608684 RepID=UPI001C9E3796|nr:hypothetical protein [Paenibacillus tengchongensis]
MYIEDRSTAVITLAETPELGHRADEIITRLQGMTAWAFLTQVALTYRGQQYDFHMI